tara:strand:+ start:350 stop:475 length:126 start_codon:yes stop_codon:yes gene_type:complete
MGSTTGPAGVSGARLTLPGIGALEESVLEDMHPIAAQRDTG